VIAIGVIRLRTRHRRVLLGAVLLGVCFIRTGAAAKEFLTPLEIQKIQDAQEIDDRMKVYLEAAALRLKTAEERLTGKESQPGDPLEFYTVEEMLDGYYRCLKSVMLNLDEAVQKPRTDPARLKKALKNLKDSSEKAGKDLAVLKKLTEEKLLEKPWNLVKQALDITQGARDGAELGLSQFSEDKDKARKPPRSRR
jgi:hypothetical protein